MNTNGHTEPGLFCWVDLAAADAKSAIAFYGALFGWTAQEQKANGGSFIRLRLNGEDVGSLYQLGRMEISGGVPSHWTPYIRVENVEIAVERAEALGGRMLIAPFAVDGIARIALIRDPAGAHVGLWESLRP